jgi:hypothetical protein
MVNRDNMSQPTMLSMQSKANTQQLEVDALKREVQRQKAKASKATRKLSALASVYSQVMALDEQKEFLDSTSLPAAEKDLLLSESRKWQDEAEMLNKTLPTGKSDVSLIKELNSKVSQGIKAQLQQFEQEGLSEHVGTDSGSADAKQEDSYWSRIRKMFVTAGKYAFRIVEWIVRHPLFAMWLTRVALLIKERICREISLRLGYKHGTTDLVTYLQESAQRFYKQTFEEFALTTIYSFCNSSAFDWFSTAIAGTLGSLFGAITGGVGAVFTGFLTSGFAAAFKDTIRETILLSTSYIIIQKTGANFMEIFTGECIKDPPKVWDNSWVSWLGNFSLTPKQGVPAAEAAAAAVAAAVVVVEKEKEPEEQPKTWGLFSILGV